MQNNRRGFLKQLASIGAVLGLAPEKLMDADAVHSAVDGLSSGDIIGLANLCALQTKVDETRQSARNTCLSFIAIPETFAECKEASHDERAALYLSKQDRQGMIGTISQAMANKALQQIALGNVGQELENSMLSFLQSDTPFARGTHKISQKIGAMVRDEFFKLYSPTPRMLPDIDDYRQQGASPEDIERIQNMHENMRKLLAARDKDITFDELQELVLGACGGMSDGFFKLSEATANIFGIEGFHYSGKPPVTDEHKKQIEVMVDDLLNISGTHLDAVQRGNILQLLKSPHFWNMKTAGVNDALNQVFSYMNVENEFLMEVGNYLGGDGGSKTLSVLTDGDIYGGQNRFKCDFFEAMSKQEGLPQYFRDSMREQAQSWKSWSEPQQPEPESHSEMERCEDPKRHQNRLSHNPGLSRAQEFAATRRRLQLQELDKNRSVPSAVALRK